MYATLTIEAIDFEQELIFTPEERYAQLTLYVQQLQLSVESNLSTVVAEFFLGNYLKGVGISSIVKTSSVGLVDTYTITFTDNTTTTFDVTNGEDGSDGIGISNIELVSTVGKVKTYRITFTNSSTFEYTITDGVDGRGIVSIIKTSTVGLVDTYTITYSDTTTSTFDVTNGINGEMNVIEEVQVNSVPLTVTNKSVNVIVPTQPSDIGAEPANSNIQNHIADETIHHTIKELNEVYEPKNSNIQSHISDSDIHHTFGQIRDNLGINEETGSDTKYLDEKGQFKEIAIGSSGYSAHVYATTIDSDITGYKKSSNTAESSETFISTTLSNSTVLVEEYIYDAPLGITQIPNGSWRFTYYAKIGSTNPQGAKLRFSVYARGITGTETLLFTKDSPTFTNTDYIQVLPIEFIGDLYTCLATDRIVFKVYAITTSVHNITVSYIVGDGRGLYVDSPLQIRHSGLREKNEEAAYQHIDSSSELGEAINETNHSLLLWNGLKALKVTFARLKTWIGSYFFAIGGNTFGAKKRIGSTDNQDFGIITNNLERVAVTKDGKVGIGTTNPAAKLDVNGQVIIGTANKINSLWPLFISDTSNLGWQVADSAGVPKFELYTGFSSINEMRLLEGVKIIGFGQDLTLGTTNNKSAVTIKNTTGGNVGIGTTAPKSKLKVAGGIQCGDDTAAASADKVGTIRQRDVDNKTKLEFVRNNNGTYEWEQINDKLSLDQSTPQTINGKVTVNGQVDATTTDVNQSTIPSVNGSQTAAILQDGSSFTGTDYVMPTNNVAVKIVTSAAHTMGDFTIRVKSSATLTSTTATLTGYLYSDNAGSPGTLLATGNAIRHGSITTSYQELSLGTQYNMVSGTTYWLVIRWNSSPTGGNIILDSNVSSNLGATSPDATTWTLTNVQLRYRLRGITYYGINAFSTNNYGVYGSSTNNIGVRGDSTNSNGVYGSSTNSNGVAGYSTNSTGVYGLSTNSFGVYGQSTNGFGVTGTSLNYYGVYGTSTNGVGVYGLSTNSFGVYGLSTNSYAGYFTRNTQTPTSSVSVLYAYQQHASNTNSVFDIRQNGTGEIIRGFSNTTQTFSVTAAGLGIFAKGVQIGDNTDVASAANVGATRYRTSGNTSYYEMVMQTGASTYSWITIVTNTW